MSAVLRVLVFAAALFDVASASCKASDGSPKICEPGGDRGFIFPLPGHPEAHLDKRAKVFLYGFGMLYSFIGVSIVADMFMSAIERITSKTRRVRVAGTNRFMTVHVWNETVANLTLMALGSSAPEILLAINDIIKRRFYDGTLGPSTIVGSAAFNLFVIVAVCINAIPAGETRQIKATGVFLVTAVFSIFAYLWLLFIVQFNSKNVIEVWEGVLTFLFFPVLVSVSYAADVGLLGPYLLGIKEKEEEEDESDAPSDFDARSFKSMKSVRSHAPTSAAITHGGVSHGQSFRSHAGASRAPSEDKGEDDLLLACADCASAQVSACASGCMRALGNARRKLCSCCKRNGLRGLQEEASADPGTLDLEDPDGLILDDDGLPIDNIAGIVTFVKDVMTIVGGLQEKRHVVPVLRKNGVEGRVSCKYRMERLTAAPGYDYVEEEGQVEFKDGATNAEIPITILKKRIGEKSDQFQLILDEPTGGLGFNPLDDGGEERAVLTVTILNENAHASSPGQRLYHILDGLVNVDEARLGFASWWDQIVEAFYVNGSPEAQEDASVADWMVHVLFFMWKCGYALLTPPPTFWGGKVCFVVSLCHIGILTAMIGDLAELFGCAAGLQDSITAITFVALGTSLPDLFASKMAAQQDEWADASIVNVTGSNSVNVFLGIGLPWMMASLYWRIHSYDDEWLGKYGAEFLADYPNGAFIVDTGDLAFSVIVFTIFALTCLVVIRVRRVVYGGELGGPSGSDAKACSSFFMVLLWVCYIILSVWKTVTCTDSAMAQLIAILTVVPIIIALMIFFMLMLQLLKISKDYIGEEGFFGIFVAISVLALRAIYFFMFQADG